MVNIKRITIVLLSLFFAFSPILENVDFSYADNTEWSTITSEAQLSAAMKAYAMAEYNISTKFAQVGINDPITNAIIGWSYTQFKKAADNANINLNALQGSIKYKVANDGLLQFAYSGSYIQDYNSLIEQYLIQNGLSPNDIQFDQQIYSGKLITDDDGNSCYVYEISSDATLTSSSQYKKQSINYISKWGSPLKYDSAHIYNLVSNINDSTSVSFNFDDVTYTTNSSNDWATVKLIQYTGSETFPVITSNDSYWAYMSKPLNKEPFINTNPHYSVFHYGNYYTLGIIWFNVFWKNSEPNTFSAKLDYVDRGAFTDYVNNHGVNASINIAKSGLKNGLLQQGKNAAIAVGKYGAQNAADAIKNYIDDNEPETPAVDNDVDDGEDPEYPDTPQPPINIGFPIGGAAIGNGNNFSFNFEMPDLSQLPTSPQSLPNNFSLPVLKTKFPFCLIYDIPAVLSLFEAQPQAPRFQGTIDLGVFNYNLDINLNYFDSVMVYCRAMIFILYVFCLIFITKELLF